MGKPSIFIDGEHGTDTIVFGEHFGEQRGIETPVLAPHIHEIRNRTRMRDGIGGRGEGPVRHRHAIARLHTGREQREMQPRGPVDRRD